ncbi:MAG: alginate lyase family protein [Ignavibacteriales bacterium]|nr:alginate lyase family protein [Ignavibacteriales bacterium]
MKKKVRIYIILFTFILFFPFLITYNISYAQCLSLNELEKERVVAAAKKYLLEQPVTITSYKSARSAGGLHDYFSEGDYWWPDTANPDGPYIQRDGLSNPDNFVSHRQALMRFSVQASTLAAAYKITGEEKYAAHALLHIKAWFVTPSSRMNPHLKFAQAIKGKVTGRGIGIIDTIHLIEIAKAIEVLEKSKSWSVDEFEKVKGWFKEYLDWMTTHKYGIDERDAKNNHGTCWVFQVAAFAELVGDTAKMNFCRDRFKNILLPEQMAKDGSFPLELKRTKPYGYSLFNLEAMTGICQILSTKDDNLWKFTLEDGRNMGKAMEFIYPFIKEKSKWTYPKDVMFFDEWPVRQSSLLFAGIALERPAYISLWKQLNPDPTVDEVVRNFPVRQPVLWMNDNYEFLNLILLDGETLKKIRSRFESGDKDILKKVNHLVKQSEKILKLKPMTVIDKESFPPSGDKHDYMSVAPYWWPDTTKPDGLPYVRRDGERNPDREKIGDRKRIGDMIESVYTLGLTYYITRDEKFAKKAADFLRVWFLNPESRMNPNLNYAQSIRGRTEGRGAGIIDSYKFTDLLDAIRLIECSTSWTQEDNNELIKWFDDYLKWLLTSDNGKSEAEAKNNHGTTYAVQVSTIAIFVGKDSIAANFVSQIPSKRIATQIEPDGSEPFELVRTKSWGYCLLNLEGLMQLAKLGERFGIDLWNFTTTDGRSIRKVIDWLTPYALGKNKWTYPQIVPMEIERMYPVLKTAAIKYNEPAYSKHAKIILEEYEIKSETILFYSNYK